MLSNPLLKDLFIKLKVRKYFNFILGLFLKMNQIDMSSFQTE